MEDDYQDLKAWFEHDYTIILNEAKQAVAANPIAEDRAILANMVHLFERSSRVLVRAANHSNTGKTELRALLEFMGAQYLIGSRGGFTERAKSYFFAGRAKEMRNLLAAKKAPKRRALLKAIIAVRGDGPVEHACKEADGILPDVNERIKSDGHEPVKVDVVRRVLEKFPRS
ncbi:MAG: hypothetical protein CR217_15975 [Beijerinckiaceae bacterium]|nr:MAG: hypothetical protein CR217_15975 [Beijerinckiaceae bacterium]